MGSKLYNSADIKESLRHNLQKKRKEKGFKTQDAFAEALEVSVESVRNWEQGRTLPELGTLFHICSLLDCDMDYLIGRLEVPTHDLAFIKEQTDPEKLYDVKELKLNISETVNRRSQRYFKLVQNPYTIRVGDMKVKLNFGNGKTLYDSLLDIAADKNCQ